MTTSATNDEDETPCDDSASPWSMRLAAGSAQFLGCSAGRVGFARDARDAVHRIEGSPEPIELSIWTL